MVLLSGLDDAALWRAASSDDHDAFRELYERHVRDVFAFCARRTGDLALAEDLTSVVFLEAWRRRRSVEIANESALPWLLGTANNVARNAQRALRRYRAALARLPAHDTFSAPEQDDAAARIDAQRALSTALRAIEELSVEEREVVNLVLWGGVAYDDAARSLAVPAGTVRSRVARARKKLAKSLAVEMPSTQQESL